MVTSEQHAVDFQLLADGVGGGTELSTVQAYVFAQTHAAAGDGHLRVDAHTLLGDEPVGDLQRHLRGIRGQKHIGLQQTAADGISGVADETGDAADGFGAPLGDQPEGCGEVVYVSVKEMV